MTREPLVRWVAAVVGAALLVLVPLLVHDAVTAGARRGPPSDCELARVRLGSVRADWATLPLEGTLVLTHGSDGAQRASLGPFELCWQSESVRPDVEYSVRDVAVCEPPGPHGVPLDLGTDDFLLPVPHPGTGLAPPFFAWQLRHDAADDLWVVDSDFVPPPATGMGLGGGGQTPPGLTLAAAFRRVPARSPWPPRVLTGAAALLLGVARASKRRARRTGSVRSEALGFWALGAALAAVVTAAVAR